MDIIGNIKLISETEEGTSKAGKAWAKRQIVVPDRINVFVLAFGLGCNARTAQVDLQPVAERFAG